MEAEVGRAVWLVWITDVRFTAGAQHTLAVGTEARAFLASLCLS